MGPQTISPLRLLRGQVALFRRASNHAARLFGIRAEDREGLVRAMIDHHQRDRPTYWLHLILAMGIATLGLVLGSTAIVIGAMLISPLMGPIVDLGMGLAVGSPFLVIRSFLRVCASIVGVVAGSALITLVLPFHELTQELVARTTPNALDLVVAIFCALAGAFTTARNASDTTTSAAGTAIGISLVPPLCVIGYGLGTGRWDVSTGASLLFTANLSAIVLFAVLVFFSLGFGQVDAHGLEERTIVGERARQPVARTARWLEVLFGARYSPLLRLSLPFLLVAAVYLPLRHALTEVSWQVRVRTAVTSLLERTPDAKSIMRSNLLVEHHKVWMQLVVVGGRERVRELETRLRTEVTRVAGVEPELQVLAVADAAQLDRTVSLLEKVPPMPIEHPPDLGELRVRVRRALDERWPASAGPLLGWTLELSAGTVAVALWHHGSPLGPAGEELLGKELSSALGSSLRVRDHALAMTPLTATPDEGARWLAHLDTFLAPARALEGLRVCVELPAQTLVERRLELAMYIPVAEEILGRLPGGQLEVQRGTSFRAALLMKTDPCPRVEVPAAPERKLASRRRR